MYCKNTRVWVLWPRADTAIIIIINNIIRVKSRNAVHERGSEFYVSEIVCGSTFTYSYIPFHFLSFFCRPKYNKRRPSMKKENVCLADPVWQREAFRFKKLPISDASARGRRFKRCFPKFLENRFADCQMTRESKREKKESESSILAPGSSL